MELEVPGYKYYYPRPGPVGRPAGVRRPGPGQASDSESEPPTAVPGPGYAGPGAAASTGPAASSEGLPAAAVYGPGFTTPATLNPGPAYQDPQPDRRGPGDRHESRWLHAATP